MANARLRAASLVLIILASSAACSEPEIGGRISAAPSSPRSRPLPSDSPTPTTPAPQPAPVQKLGPAPANLHDVDWASATLPGDFCDIDGLVKFKKQQATAKSMRWGKVQVAVWPEDTQYGDADGQDEAAVYVDCNTGGGTAGDQIQSAYIVVRGADGFLVTVGTITPQQKHKPAAAPSTRLHEARFSQNRITVRELFLPFLRRKLLSHW